MKGERRERDYALEAGRDREGGGDGTRNVVSKVVGTWESEREHVVIYELK